MTQSDPNTPSPDPRSSLGALIEAFAKLPPLLSYGGLILIAAIVILSISGVLPDALLWLPAAAIVAFLVYANMQFAEEKARRQFELKKQAQELKHEQEMARLTKPDKPEPTPDTSRESPDTNDQLPATNDQPTPAEWERRYLRHLIHLCGYPPSMALVDVKEAGLGGQKLALDRIFTSLDVPAADGHAADSRPDPTHTALNFDQLDPAQSERLQREPALACISRAANSRLVILGAPGSGKSHPGQLPHPLPGR